MTRTPFVILGVSCDFHDSAAAVLVDGVVVAAAEEERFSREKHDASIPAGAIDACLRVAGLPASAVDVVAFYERPVDVVSRFLASRRRQGPAGFASFVRDAPSLVGRNLMVAYRIDRVLRRLGASRSPRFCYVDHHRSHAAAAFFASPYGHAAVVTVDGIGEWTTASIGRGSGRRLELLEEMRYPDSLGLVYSFVTAYCGFHPNSDEYKLMGLAPYGRPRFAAELEDLVDVKRDGSVAVDVNKLGWYGRRGLGRRDLHRRFDGPPTAAGSPATLRDADLAASVQQLTEVAISRLATHARQVTGEERLCLGGGVALNCVANGKLLAEGTFDGIWVQPAAGDAGSALGAALSVWHEELGHDREADGTNDAMQGSLLGPAVSPSELTSWLADRSLGHRRVPDEADRCRLVAERLAAGDVVGWFQGRMEFGPRALGNRSILADPRSATMRTRLNESVKGRETFRPFAPAVLEEHASSWFELGAASPYMLMVAPVLGVPPVEVERSDAFAAAASSVRSPLAACTHVDGSARVQTVDRHTNPRFRRLVEEFHDRTGCPVLLNTSFNVAGQPIVASPDDAVATARAASLDLLVIEDVVIERHQFEAANG